MNTYLKITSIAIIALIIGSLVAPISVYATEPPSAPSDQPVVDRRPYRFLDNVTFEELLQLAYMVRNETYPLLNWAIDHNSTVAEAIKARGDWFFQKALEYRDIDERFAKVALLIATVIYSRAPVSTYQVLVLTIRSNLGENHTITNETVLAVHDIAGELRELTLDAREYALSYNVTLPYAVEALILRGDYRLNQSMEKLEENLTRLALILAIGGYTSYARAYGIIVRATITDFIEKIVGEFKNPEAMLLNLQLVKPEVIQKRISIWRARIPTINIGQKEGKFFVILPIRNPELVINKLVNIVMYKITKIVAKHPQLRQLLISKYGYTWRYTLRNMVKNIIENQLAMHTPLEKIVKNVIHSILSELGLTGIHIGEHIVVIRHKH